MVIELKSEGIVLLSNYNGKYLGSSEFEEVFKELDKRKAVVFIHPTDPNRVALAVSGGNVFVTENGGGSWTNISHNLPNFTAYTVAWHGNADNGLYVGMNYGVFYIDDTFIADTTYWQDFSNNLPNRK